MNDPNKQLRALEALLFSAKEPLTEQAISEHMPAIDNLNSLLLRLSDDYLERGVNLVNVAGGWVFRTAPDLATVLRHVKETERKLSRAAMETLAIIAFHQPGTRLEIEQIRGVLVSKGTLDILFDADWIAPKGRRKTPGRPVTWVTTPEFLKHFDLASIDDLPGIDELRAAGLLDAQTPPLFIAESVDPVDEMEDPDDGEFILEVEEK